MLRGSRRGSRARVARALHFGTIALLASFAAHARAQAGADEPEAARADEATVGDASDAQPGYLRTRVAGERPRGFAADVGLGYGFTESVPGAPGPHHRLPFSLAISGQPWTFLGLGVRLDGRGDFHPDDGRGADRGFVGQGAIDVRAAGFVGGGLALGANLSLLVLGGDDGLGDGAVSLEATGLGSFRKGGLSLALEAGYRLDQSGETASPATLYRPGDRLALGISDFDALLLRAGAGYRRGAIEGAGELRWDLLVGEGAPKVGESPLHVAALGRFHASEAIELELSVDVTLSSRPSVGNGDPFVVVDPRVAARAGLAYRFGRAREGAERVEAPAAVEIEASAEPPADAPRTLEGVVRDERGAPIVDARVVVRVGAAELEAYSDAEGRFRVEGVPPGEASVDITATQHAPVHLALGARDARLPERELTLAAAEAVGVLRGLVRDFDGNPVRATVRLEPGGATVQVGEDGSFEVELPPGGYSVTVEARGFRGQSRSVRLSAGQVTIYNVDLRGAR